jgi:CheY-like chemotaxis protein/DNA-binding CsgD family transcriptional regulator
MNKYKILIVNDQEVNYQIISSYLELGGGQYSTIQAKNGKIACEVAEKEFPDLIIMDWDMPVMNGIDAIIQLKQMETTKDIPVIMLTAVNKSSANLQTAFNAGALDFVRQPIDKIEFLARVKSVLLINNYYRQKVEAEHKAKLLLEENLRHKNHELTLLALNSTYKMNLLVTLKNEVKTIFLNGNCPEIKNLRSMLTSFDENESDWEVFKNQFEVIHSGFFIRLEESHPGLTANEKRFCAYIKIGMSSNDIAKLLNISMEGIKKSRYRLRRKFGLQTQENLENYIAKI